MKKHWKYFNLFSAILLLSILPVSVITGQDAEPFKPSGKVEARLFTNLSTTFADGHNHTKFDVGRAYIGYNYNFTRNFSGRVVYDVADPGAGKNKYSGMLKYAYMKYQKGNLTVTGGMIALPNFEYGNSIWGYRYVYKPVHDEYGFGQSADLGLSAEYKFSSMVSADVAVSNGEGFKSFETDSIFKVGAGVTLKPANGFALRGYVDNMSKNSLSQQTYELIASYENKGSRIGVSYNFRNNNGMVKDRDYQGVSVNGSLAVNNKVKVFGRYDYVTSSSIVTESGSTPWNIAKDGQLFIGGIEFALAPGINFSPNFSGWNPAADGMPFVSRISASLDLKF